MATSANRNAQHDDEDDNLKVSDENQDNQDNQEEPEDLDELDFDPDEDYDDDVDEADDTDNAEEGDDEDPFEFLDDDEYDDDEEGEDGGDDDVSLEIKRLRRENAHRRIQNRELQERAASEIEQSIANFSQTFANELGLKIDDDYTAEAMAQAVQEQIESERQRAIQARRDLAIYQAAGPAGADFNKLADSKTFTRAVDQLDPNADDYTQQIGTLVTKALDQNPEWKKPPTINRSGGDFTNTTPNLEGDSIEALQKRRRNRRIQT